MADVHEPPLAQPMGQQGQRFGGCEMRADAGSGAGAEGQVLETMAAALFGETLDVERVRIGPQLLVTVEDPRPDRDDVARFHRPLAEPVRTDCLPVEPRHGRIKPQRLAEELANPDAAARRMMVSM